MHPRPSQLFPSHTSRKLNPFPSLITHSSKSQINPTTPAPQVVVGSPNADIYVEIEHLPKEGETISAQPHVYCSLGGCVLASLSVMMAIERIRGRFGRCIWFWWWWQSGGSAGICSSFALPIQRLRIFLALFGICCCFCSTMRIDGKGVRILGWIVREDKRKIRQMYLVWG